jgi:hypothetical protein
MYTVFYAFSFLVVSVAGWMNQHQQQVIEYLMEENQVLREQIGTRRMRFSDDQRRRLAAKAKKLDRKLSLANQYRGRFSRSAKQFAIDRIGSGNDGMRIDLSQDPSQYFAMNVR